MDSGIFNVHCHRISRDPFADVERTVLKECDGFSVGERDILEIHGRANHLLFQQSSKYLDMRFSGP
jgi:hypothetical protein